MSRLQGLDYRTSTTQQASAASGSRLRVRIWISAMTLDFESSTPLQLQLARLPTGEHSRPSLVVALLRQRANCRTTPIWLSDTSAVAELHHLDIAISVHAFHCFICRHSLPTSQPPSTLTLIRQTTSLSTVLRGLDNLRFGVSSLNCQLCQILSYGVSLPEDWVDPCLPFSSPSFLRLRLLHHLFHRGRKYRSSS